MSFRRGRHIHGWICNLNPVALEHKQFLYRKFQRGGENLGTDLAFAYKMIKL